MNRATAERLNEINRSFYHELGASFSQTRAAAWLGWRRLLPWLREIGAPDRPASVLDVGCGNARFARFLARELDRPLLYTGVDASAILLAEARVSAPARLSASFAQLDLVSGDPDRLLPEAEFDCVAAFGLLHHVPGAERRLALMRAMGRRVRSAGLLTLTFFRFAEHPRFDRRQIAWQEHNGRSALPIDLAELERGDTLLRWGGAESSAYRYCHDADPAEREALVAASGLPAGEAFLADGGLNDYRVLCRR